MPSFNLLILPILGAFYFIETNHFYKVKYSLHDRQRYIYTSFLFAFYLLIPSFAIASAVKHEFPAFSYFILKNLPIKEPHVGTSLLSFLVGFSSAHISNWITSKENILKKLVEKYGGEVERLTLECFTNKELLQVSLKNDKVYIGFISEVKFTLDNQIIILDPVFSGYRDEYKKIQIITDYLEAFETFESFYDEGEEVQLATEDNPMSFTKLYLKKNEINTLSKFHLGLYFAFNEIDQKETPSDSIKS